MVDVYIDKVEVGTELAYSGSSFFGRYTHNVPEQRVIRVSGHLSRDFFPFWVKVTDQSQPKKDIYGTHYPYGNELATPLSATFVVTVKIPTSEFIEGQHEIEVTAVWTPVLVPRAGSGKTIQVDTVGRNDFTIDHR